MGETTTLETYTNLCDESHCQDYNILWTYSPNILQIFTPIASWKNNISKTDYNDLFKDTLQVDLGTGSLTLRNIKHNQSGYYHVEVLKTRQPENNSLYDVIVYGECGITGLSSMSLVTESLVFISF